MGNIHFRLNRGVAPKEPQKQYSIFLRYQIGVKIDFMASTKLKALPKEWDNEKERIKASVSIPDYPSKNNFLDKLEHHFKEYDNKNLRNGYIPSYYEIREHFKAFWNDNSKEQKRSSTIFEFIETFIKKSEENNTVTGGTLKSYKLARDFFKGYDDEVERVSFETIDEDWYNRFVNWCRKKNYTENYIGKNIKFLKLILRRAFEENISENKVFENKKFKVLREDVENIYLDLKELEMLWKLKLDKHPEHEKVRDAFLIGCYTGLRVSDFKKVSKEDIITYKGQKMIKVVTAKNQKPIAIPVHPVVESILKKYNGELPKNLYEQKINDLIKVVGEWAGIDEAVVTFVTKGGRKQGTRKPKYEFIKTHTARRSFCTNAYNLEMPTVDIMAISGHSSEKTFLNYIKTSKEDIALKVSKHKFFTNGV